MLMTYRVVGVSGAEAVTLNVSAPSGFFSFSNVVSGDVYVCGGQSNMAFATSQVRSPKLTVEFSQSSYT